MPTGRQIRSALGVLRRIERGEHLTAAVDAHLLEYRFQVVLDGVAVAAMHRLGGPLVRQVG